MNTRIKVIETTAPTPKRMTPAEIVAGQNVVNVILEKPITLLLDDESIIVTYEIGEHEAPAHIATILWQQGAELPGTEIKRDSAKPQQKWPTGMRGGLAGCVRFKI
jgi:hypothetical protein